MGLVHVLSSKSCRAPVIFFQAWNVPRREDTADAWVSAFWALGWVRFVRPVEGGLHVAVSQVALASVPCGF